MKYGWLVLPPLALAFFITNDVLAACDTNVYPNTLAISSIQGKGIDAHSPGSPPEEWKEDHCAGGNLYKVGDGSLPGSGSVDPRVLRGTWTFYAGGYVRYNYGPTSDYVWKVYSNDSGGLCWESPLSHNIVAEGTTVPLSGPCP